VTRAYDGLNRLMQEVTPEGTVSYTYDGASRRATMAVLGQPTVSYTYDNADRLTQIAQSTSTTTLAYDAVSRRTALTLPNGIVVEYAYDTASRLTGLTYKLGAAALGVLTYAYDTSGNRLQVGGTWARTDLPDAVSAASYNVANQQLTFGPDTMTFDNNGNLATRADSSGMTEGHQRGPDRLSLRRAEPGAGEGRKHGAGEHPPRSRDRRVPHQDRHSRYSALAAGCPWLDGRTYRPDRHGLNRVYV
jgi:YD repeat-containing protein